MKLADDKKDTEKNRRVLFEGGIEECRMIFYLMEKRKRFVITSESFAHFTAKFKCFSVFFCISIKFLHFLNLTMLGKKS